VHHVLTYEGYTGVAAWGKRQNLTRTTRQPRPRSEWLSLQIPAIIDVETFQAAQQQLQRHKATATRNRKHEYLLVNGRFRCGRCGRSMTGIPRRTRLYYVCSSFKNLVDRTQRCHGAVRADAVEPTVWQAVMRVLEYPDVIAAEVARQQATAGEQRAEVQQDITLIDTALTKYDREEQR
jgi:site-specific DNA recombinase